MLDDFVIVSLFLLNAAEINHVNKDTFKLKTTTVFKR